MSIVENCRTYTDRAFCTKQYEKNMKRVFLFGPKFCVISQKSLQWVECWRSNVTNSRAGILVGGAVVQRIDGGKILFYIRMVFWKSIHDMQKLLWEPKRSAVDFLNIHSIVVANM
jgi:hypothetical protein